MLPILIEKFNHYTLNDKESVFFSNYITVLPIFTNIVSQNTEIVNTCFMKIYI